MVAMLPTLAGAAPQAAAEVPPALGEAVLSREVLIDQVLANNPTVESMRQAWREAISRYPQVTALADPMLSYGSAPRSIGSEHGYGSVVQLSQRLEWPGKQALRGAVAKAEAEAQGADLERVQLHLALTASILFDDHFVVQRSLEINGAHTTLVTSLRQSAMAQYAAGRGSQQAPLQADVALALLEQERLRLHTRQQIIIAQINGLLHRDPTSALPAAPATLTVASAPAGSAAEWAERAQRDRPELRAGQERIAARRSGLRLAERAYFPDISISGTNSTMWPQPEHQLMLGLSLNIPLGLGARRAGVDQASAALARARAMHADEQDRVAVDLRQAWLGLEEAIAQAGLYQDRILPAARRQVSAAEAGYLSGRESFSELVTAERRLRSFEQAHAEALAQTWRSRAALDRAAGQRAEPSAPGGAR
jgi:outer membrane protein TolC